MLRPSRTCDVCRREIPEQRRAYVELRLVAVRCEPDGRTTDHPARTETCSEGCSLTAARAVIERAWAIYESRVLA